MHRYIVEIADGVIRFLDDQAKHRSIVPHCVSLTREMKRLDPRDFLPDGRYEFVAALVDVEQWVKEWEHRVGDLLNTYLRDERSRAELKTLMQRVIDVLGKYGGEGWKLRTRSFSFITDEGLRKIIERDYKELTLVLFPGGAWKSTVIMAGSILEAILFDQLVSDTAVHARAITSPIAPTDRRTGTVKDIDDWRLEQMIAVAADIGVLPRNRKEVIDHVLRDYRNFVHPKKEIRSAYSCEDAEAQLAIGGLNAVCDMLQRP